MLHGFGIKTTKVTAYLKVKVQPFQVIFIINIKNG